MSRARPHDWPTDLEEEKGRADRRHITVLASPCQDNIDHILACSVPHCASAHWYFYDIRGNGAFYPIDLRMLRPVRQDKTIDIVSITILYRLL